MMKNSSHPSLLTLAALVIATPSFAATKPPIVGTWIVRDSAAPFPFHMYVFNADGTMQQANPDAGHAGSSDSDGKGVWAMHGGVVKGRWVEITADRATHKFAGFCEIIFELAVTGDGYSGTEQAQCFNPDRAPNSPIMKSTITGERVTLAKGVIR